MAKYDHGGGCACGLSRFCDCSNATEQDRKDREAYERFMKKDKKMSGRGDDAVALGRAPADLIKQAEGDFQRQAEVSMKPTNPKDAIGIKKPRCYSAMSAHVDRLVSIALMEGAMKYGRHNYRPAAVRASVYYDAMREHAGCWWEGEDIDPDSKLSHVIKAIASLYVLADAIVTGNLVDDRPPRTRNPREFADSLQPIVDELFAKYPQPKPAYTEKPL